MHTRKYNDLVKRLKLLKRIYIPSELSPTGDYSEDVYEYTRAYIVLTHAEMEYYFEQIALDTAKKAFDKWKNNRKATIPILAMVSYYDGTYHAIPEQMHANNAQEDLNKRVKLAYDRYNKIIRSSNHGIKEKNILNIFLPLGINITEINEDMLIALNNFGVRRGIEAHSSGTKTTPDDAVNMVCDLINKVQVFDELVSSFKRKI